MNWWQRLRRRDRLERELDAELRFHLDRMVADNIRSGMSPAEARRQARLEFGGLDQMKEECRDARGTRWVHDMTQDIRFAARLLARERAFTALAVMTLALGIGVTSTFFTVVHSLCLRGPLREPAGLVHVGTRNAAGLPGGMSSADFFDLRPLVQSLDAVAAYAALPMAAGDEERAPERVTGAYVSADTFRILRETPVAGRDFTPDDDRPGAPPVALLAAGLWKRRYGGDSAVLGRPMRINGATTTIIGIVREGLRFPDDAEVWLPLASMPGLATQPRAARTLGVFGRLTDGRNLARAQADVDQASRQLEQAHPRSNNGVRMTAVPINDRFTARITDTAWVAFITAGILVLLVACANVANLLLARAVRRSGEIAIRTALGATRARIVRQLLVECALLAAAAGAAGLLLSQAGVRLLSAAIPEGALPSWMHLTMDVHVLALLAGVCVATVFVFGFVPALHTSRTGVRHAVRDRGQGRAAGIAARRWTTAFMTVQFALTFVLVAAVLAGLRAVRDDPEIVIDPGNVLTTWMTLPPHTYEEPADRLRFYERLVQDTVALADVSSVSLVSVLPSGGAPARQVAIAGRESTGGTALTTGLVSIDTRYFATLRTGVLEGRNFTAEDGLPGHETVIVNQRFALTYFPDGDAVGHRIRLVTSGASADLAPWLTIVGVSPKIPQGARRDPPPVVYQPFRASAPATAALMVRARAGAEIHAATLRDRVRDLDPDLPLYRTMMLERAMADAGWNPRVASALITTISAITLALAIVGLCGVTAHGVAARAREIGIRVALGARPRDVSWLVLRRAMFQLAIGVLTGAGCAIVWNRLFGVSAPDAESKEPLVLAAAAILIAGFGLAACLFPARRAVRLDRLEVLRQE